MREQAAGESVSATEVCGRAIAGTSSGARSCVASEGTPDVGATEVA